MPVEFICDGCGKRELGHASWNGTWLKPTKWFERKNPDTGKWELACSRECTEKLGGIVAPW